MSSILLALLLLSLFYLLTSSYFTLRFFGNLQKQKATAAIYMPPVSIIKPITKTEAEHFDNFATFCEQDYGDYEIIFAFVKEDHSVIADLELLKAKFPHCRIRWVMVSGNRGPNYKVGNVAAAVRNACYDTLVISDSDMRVGPDYLKHVVEDFMEERVGVVTCLYRGANVCNLNSALQALFIQGDFIPQVMVGQRLQGISYAFGATICTSKSVLERIGGLEPLKDYLADDYQIGYRAHRAGYLVKLSSFLVDHVSVEVRFRDYYQHLLRWSVTQRISRPFGYFASVITHGVSLATLLCLVDFFSLQSVVFWCLVLAVRIGSFAFLNHSVIHNPTLTKYLWLMPFKDLLNSFFWLMSFFTNKVHWKHRKFRVLKNGRMIQC